MFFLCVGFCRNYFLTWCGCWPHAQPSSFPILDLGPGNGGVLLFIGYNSLLYALHIVDILPLAFVASLPTSDDHHSSWASISPLVLCHAQHFFQFRHIIIHGQSATACALKLMFHINLVAKFSLHRCIGRMVSQWNLQNYYPTPHLESINFHSLPIIVSHNPRFTSMELGISTLPPSLYRRHLKRVYLVIAVLPIKHASTDLFFAIAISAGY